MTRHNPAMTAHPASEYRLIESRSSGETWVLHPRSMTCGGPLHHADRAAIMAGDVSLASCPTDDDAEPWMLDEGHVRLLVVQG